MLAYVKPGLLNLDRSLKQPTAQSSTEMLWAHTGETRSHTFVHAQTYAAYLYVCIHMQRHACADRG